MNKINIFRVSRNNGQAFIATAELLGIDKHDLLDFLMGNYVKSVQKSIMNTAGKYPSFSSQHSFIEHPSQDDNTL